MKSPPPALFPLLRSDLQAKILIRTFLGDQEESVADLASAIGTDPGNTAREIARLEQASILASRRVGRTKLVSADHRAPHYEALHTLITIVLGPVTVLAEELHNVDGIAVCEIFGSWAARLHGEPGPTPRDIDVLIVGDPDLDDLHDAIQRAGSRLNRAVNPVVVTERRWNDDSADGFLRELRTRPRAPIPMDRTAP